MSILPHTKQQFSEKDDKNFFPIIAFEYWIHTIIFFMQCQEKFYFW